MLTAFQCEVAAFITEYGEIVCRKCAHDKLDEEGGGAVENYTPLIRYALDEEQSYRAEDAYDGEDGHVEDCECEPAVCCEQCGDELVSEYVDTNCEELQTGEEE